MCWRTASFGSAIYQTSRFLTVKGPARIIVSVDGVKVEAGKAVEVSRETCGFGRSIGASGRPGCAGCQLQEVAISPALPAEVRAKMASMAWRERWVATTWASLVERLVGYILPIRRAGAGATNSATIGQSDYEE